MPTTTLRDLDGSDQSPASLTNATLLLINYQNTYTRGILELTGWGLALEAAASLLLEARSVGTKIIHIIQDGGTGTPCDIRKDTGRIHNAVAPGNDEPVIVKKLPNSFINTDLADHIDAAGNKHIIIAGFMTHLSIVSTAEAAFVRGNNPTIVANACATRSIKTYACSVSASELQRSALAIISDRYGVVVPSITLIKKQQFSRQHHNKE